MSTSINISPSDGKRPQPTINEIIELVLTKYGLAVDNIQELNGYDDRNYKVNVSNKPSKNENIKDIWPHGYVLKIINSEDSKNTALIQAQNSLTLHLDKDRFNVPKPVLNKDGQLYSLIQLENTPDRMYVMKLLIYQPGILLNDQKPSPELYENVGKFVAKVDKALETFHHKAYDNYRSLWQLISVPEISKYYSLVTENTKRIMVEKCVNNFIEKVLPYLPKLQQGIIHGDLNEHNLLTENDNIIALLDFGDCHYAPYLFELAICICYILIHSKNIAFGKYVILGYQQYRKLENIEKKLLKICICARLSQSLVLGLQNYNITKNKYVLSSHKFGWNILEELFNYDDDQLKEDWFS